MVYTGSIPVVTSKYKYIMRNFTHKVIIAITYATVIGMTTLALSGIGFLIFGLITGKLDADFGIYR